MLSTFVAALVRVLPVLVELLGLAMLSAAAWLRVGLWLALLVAGVALVLKANYELGTKPSRTRLIRIPSGMLTNRDVDLAPEAPPLTNGAVDTTRV